MKGLTKFFPTPSDKMGTLWALSAVKDACIIEYGPGGTTHYSMEGIFKINGEILADTYTTHIDEDDVVMGDTTRIRDTILEVDEIYKPKYIFVIASSLISVIGTDIQGVVYELSGQVKAKLIVYQSGGFKGDYTVGIQQVLKDLAQHVVLPCEQKVEMSYNIIGCCLDDYRYAANIKAIQAVLSETLGLHCVSVWTAGGSMDTLEKASSATINIVLRQEGFECAKILQKRFGTPFLYAHPIGYKATIDMIERIANQLGLTPDEACMKEIKARMRQNLMHVKRHFRPLADKSVVISGGYDTANAYAHFLGDELGFEIRRVLVNHKKMSEEVSGHYCFNAGEDDKEAAAETKPRFIFGDAVLVYFAKTPCYAVQIQNPNLNQVVMTTHKPTMCFHGADDTVEKLLNSDA